MASRLARAHDLHRAPTPSALRSPVGCPIPSRQADTALPAVGWSGRLGRTALCSLSQEARRGLPDSAPPLPSIAQLLPTYCTTFAHIMGSFLPFGFGKGGAQITPPHKSPHAKTPNTDEEYQAPHEGNKLLLCTKPAFSHSATVYKKNCTRGGHERSVLFTLRTTNFSST